MSTETVRHRLSMAVFYDADELWDAVLELLRIGLGIDQQCCAGCADALIAIGAPRRMPWELSARLWALVRCVEPYVIANGPKGISATSGAVLKTLAQACPGRGGPIVSIQREKPGKRLGSCTPLREHIHAGAVLLVVSAANPDQQVASSHALLRTSRHGVQTFEFTEDAGCRS